jgi:hypothetical protein
VDRAIAELRIGQFVRMDDVDFRDGGAEVALVTGDEAIGAHAHDGGQMGGVPPSSTRSGWIARSSRSTTAMFHRCR